MAFVEGASLRFAAAAWIVAWSLVAFLTMVADKRRSKDARRRRVPERTLLTLAGCGGAPGAWLAMRLVRHKTRHLRFRVLVPLLSLLWLALFVLVVGMTQG